MKREEVLKILGKYKNGKRLINLWEGGHALWSKLVYYAKNPPKIRLFEDPNLMTKTGKQIEKLDDDRLEFTRRAMQSAKKRNGGNGHSSKSTRTTRTKKTLKPKKKSKTFTSRERGKLSTAEIVAGTGGVALTAPWAISKAINTGGLGSQITKDAKKREAYAKAKTKSKKYKSKSHMYPPPKPKRPKKSKANMYPPPKRKKRSGV